MNGLLRLTLTRELLALLVVAATASPTTTPAFVATSLRPTVPPTVLSGPLYTCNAERLPAMHKNGRTLGNGRILECKI